MDVGNQLLAEDQTLALQIPITMHLANLPVPLAHVHPELLHAQTTMREIVQMGAGKKQPVVLERHAKVQALVHGVMPLAHLVAVRLIMIVHHKQPALVVPIITVWVPSAYRLMPEQITLTAVHRLEHLIIPHANLSIAILQL